MKFFDRRIVFSTALLALLTACGGSTDTSTADTTAAAPMVQEANAPVADCEAEGCNRPRIIDGLAEQYRASAALQPALAAEPAQPAALPAPASEAAPAVPVPPQAPVLN